MRLIDADDLKTKFNKDNFKGFILTKIIDMQPTIDPESLRPQGKWSGTVCSNCGESTSFYYDCNYCPNCGAKMEQEGDNETD